MVAAETSVDGMWGEGAIPAGVYTLVARKKNVGSVQLAGFVVAGDVSAPDLLVEQVGPETCGDGIDPDGDGVPDQTEPEACRCDPAGVLDLDKDGVCDRPTDRDRDGIPDAEDNCPDLASTDPTDTDVDGAGDACDDDDDGDAILDALDNCPLLANEDQLDTDLDAEGLGDACDPDDDNDEILDALDNCPLLANEDQLDTDLDTEGLGDACDPDDDNDSNPDLTDLCPLKPDPCTIIIGPGLALVAPSGAVVDGTSNGDPIWTVGLGDVVLSTSGAGLDAFFQWRVVSGAPFELTSSGASATVHVDALFPAVIEVTATSGGSTGGGEPQTARVVLHPAIDPADTVHFDPVNGSEANPGTRALPRQDVFAWLAALEPTGSAKRELHVLGGEVPVLDGQGNPRLLRLQSWDHGTQPIRIIGGYAPGWAARSPALHPTTFDYGTRNQQILMIAGDEADAPRLRVTLDGLRLRTGSIALDCADVTLDVFRSVIRSGSSALLAFGCPVHAVGNVILPEGTSSDRRLWLQREGDLPMFDHNAILVEPNGKALYAPSPVAESARYNTFVALGDTSALYYGNSSTAFNALATFEGNALAPAPGDSTGTVFGLEGAERRALTLTKTAVAAECAGLPVSGDVWADGYPGSRDPACFVDAALALDADPVIRNAQRYDLAGTPRPEGRRAIGPVQPVDADGDGLDFRTDPCLDTVGVPAGSHCELPALELDGPSIVEVVAGVEATFTISVHNAAELVDVQVEPISGAATFASAPGATAAQTEVSVTAKTTATLALRIVATEAGSGRRITKRVLVSALPALPTNGQRVYVVPGRAAGGTGTRADPYGSFAEAVAGASATAPKDLFVAQGVLRMTSPDFPAGVRVFGGYSEDGWIRRAPYLSSSLAGFVGGPVSIVLTDSEAVFDNLSITTAPGAATGIRIVRGKPTFVRCLFRTDSQVTGGARLIRIENDLGARFISSALVPGAWKGTASAVELDGSLAEFWFNDFTLGRSPTNHALDVPAGAAVSRPIVVGNRFIGWNTGTSVLMTAFHAGAADTLLPRAVAGNALAPVRLATGLQVYREAGVDQGWSGIEADLAQPSPVTSVGNRTDAACFVDQATTSAIAPVAGLCRESAGNLASFLPEDLAADRDFEPRSVNAADIGAEEDPITRT